MKNVICSLLIQVFCAEVVVRQNEIAFLLLLIARITVDDFSVLDEILDVEVCCFDFLRSVSVVGLNLVRVALDLVDCLYRAAAQKRVASS